MESNPPSEPANNTGKPPQKGAAPLSADEAKDLLDRYERLGKMLQIFWPLAIISAVITLLVLFGTIPGDYKPLQADQTIFAVAVHPSDTSIIRLWVKQDTTNLVLESTDGGTRFVPTGSNVSDSTAQALLAQFNPVVKNPAPFPDSTDHSTGAIPTDSITVIDPYTTAEPAKK